MFRMSFGVDGERRYCLHFKAERNGTAKLRNCKIGNIVLLKEDADGNQWPMARIVDVYKDAKGNVRSVKLTTGRSKNESVRYFERPVNKLVMLLESEE